MTGTVGRQRLLPVAAFTGAYMTLALAGAAVRGNAEFLFYLAVMAILIAAVWGVDRAVRLSAGALWGLSIWGLAHMVGGLAGDAPHQGIGKGNQYTDWLESIGQDYKKLKKKHGYIPARWHQTTWCADRAIEFMKEKRSGPWLCSVNIYAPHSPFDPRVELCRAERP